jgi:hypothetical protein
MNLLRLWIVVGSYISYFDKIEGNNHNYYDSLRAVALNDYEEALYYLLKPISNDVDSLKLLGTIYWRILHIQKGIISLEKEISIKHSSKNMSDFISNKFINYNSNTATSHLQPYRSVLNCSQSLNFSNNFSDNYLNEFPEQLSIILKLAFIDNELTNYNFLKGKFYSTIFNPFQLESVEKSAQIIYEIKRFPTKITVLEQIDIQIKTTFNLIKFCKDNF